jgi:alkylation response protein AidB-like acyl-CoA dehydrogenase
LDDDGQGLRDMLDAFGAAHPAALEDGPEVAERVAALAELGVWTLGTPEALGGGGAPAALTALTFERLGRTWPALGWAAVQAHAAVEALGADTRFADVVAGLHAATAAVAVVDMRSTRAHLEWNGSNVHGTVDRVDVAAEHPHLLLIDGDTAVFVSAESLTPAPVGRTGLGGAFTRELTVATTTAAILTDVDGDAAAVRLRLGAAAVAAGLAGAAADAALGYAGDRIQFGGPLTALPTVRRTLLDQTASAITAVSGAVAAAPDPVAAFAAARHACDVAVDVAASALQSHGGYGYLAEYGAERRLRDAVSLRAAADLTLAETDSAHALVGSGPRL